MKRVEDYVTSIPDFPEPGIIFRDVTTILQDADGLCLAGGLCHEERICSGEKEGEASS